MPRFIDADALLKGLELSIKSWSGDCNSNAPTMVRAYQDVVYRVKNAPTADVVPMSAYMKQITEVEYLRRALLEVEYAVAREIFEEIDKAIAEQYPIYTATSIIKCLSELKKKYTEVEK